MIWKMEIDSYRVQVLYYLNPHLIWVEVIKDDDEILFEQIGIYGVLPQEANFDLEGTLQISKCEDWMPASVRIMKDLLCDAEEVWFKFTYLDNRHSIFDDNFHKYGDLIIKNPDGEIRSLRKSLEKSMFAFDHDIIFHEKLLMGKLKTKLEDYQILAVVKALDDFYSKQEGARKLMKPLLEQIAVIRIGNVLEARLKRKNLNRYTKDNYEKVIKKKIIEIEKCDDLYEDSVGRANIREKYCEDEQEIKESKAPLFTGSRKLLESLRMMKCGQNNKYNAGIHKMNQDVSLKENGNMDKYDDKKQYQVRKLPFGTVTENRVAYGPPNTNQAKLITKIVPTTICDEEINVKPQAIEDDVEEIPDFNMLSDVDSNVKIPITNLGILKTTVRNNDKENYSQELFKEADQIDSVMENKFQTLQAFNDNRVTSRTVEQESANLAKFDVTPMSDLNLKKNVDSVKSSESSASVPPGRMSLLLQRQIILHKTLVEKKHNGGSISDTTYKDTSSSDVQPNKTNIKRPLDSDDDTISNINETVKVNNVPIIPINETVPTNDLINQDNFKTFVNPFKHVDFNTSIFVDKLIAPVLMVHTKRDTRIQPRCDLRDLPFGNHIHVGLKNMNIKHPTILQTVTWGTILRGHSVFAISPSGGGKTMGYLPAVCRLISDSYTNKDCVGPCCIIVCGTARAVADVESKAKMFLGLEEKVLACYAGMNDLTTTTSLLNGCDLLISTPSVLIRLLQQEFGVDIRRLTTLVLDDCERLLEVYASEIKLIFFLMKDMLKNRANKELKVQLVIASRVWCDSMRALALKAPDTLICITAFQECVLYSKASTTVTYVRKENKINEVTEFLKEIDGSKKSVIVCRSNDEVEILEKTLRKLKYAVFASNSTMTVHDLYSLNLVLKEYADPLLGPTLVCCDDNLSHLNVTDANYLIHYSMPQLFSMFCKRFSVLNDSYGSVFKTDNQNVRIKIILEENNVEQLPKILNFVKRCSYEVPEVMANICKQILTEKDLVKAKSFVPICNNLLSFGECPDFWQCEERHAVIKEFDEPNEWIPKTGVITFKILHYHDAVHYSVRLISINVKGTTSKFAQTYSSLSLKLGMYFSRESNKKLHGIPVVGDICAVSIKQNFYARCQVLKVLNYYEKGNPNYILIKLIDEQKYETTRDIYLYHLPPELKQIETPVVQVRLANIRPKDRDITFSDLATENLKSITDRDETIYMRGHIVLTIGNCIFVDTLEACQDLSSLNETVLRHNFKSVLLETHALPYDNHITALRELAKELDTTLDDEGDNSSKDTLPSKVLPEIRWAHLDSDDFLSVFFASAETPEKFFVRLTKFTNCMDQLIKDINQYVKENPEPVKNVNEGDIVLAMFPDDSTYERARIDKVINANKVTCFFVDQGDWREVAIKNLVEIPDAFVTKLPFQAIECCLVGVQPAGDDWTEFSTNWLYDKCFKEANLKYLYLKYFTKAKAKSTSGYKYGVVIVDTNANEDVTINKLIIDVNLAQKDDEEFEYINQLRFERKLCQTEDCLEDLPESCKSKAVIPYNYNDDNKIAKKPFANGSNIHSFDGYDSAESECDVNMTGELFDMAKPLFNTLCQQFNKITPQITEEFNERLRPKALEDSKGKDLGTKLECLEKEKVAESNDVDSENFPTPDQLVNRSNDVDSDDFPTPDQLGSRSNDVDSDDFPTPDHLRSRSIDVDSEDFPTPDQLVNRTLPQVTELRKPKLLWSQNKATVTLKIMMIGVEKYEMVIDDRALRFNAVSNDANYGFEFELYGVIDKKKSTHSNKGQYILINLQKIMQRNWLMLTKDGGVRKWIIYDVDSLDTSSDEEVGMDDSYINTIKNICDKDESCSEDDDFRDDATFRYRK